MVPTRCWRISADWGCWLGRFFHALFPSFFVDQTVFLLVGLVMFFNSTNLDTKLMVAILGQDCSFCVHSFSICGGLDAFSRSTFVFPSSRPRILDLDFDACIVLLEFRAVFIRIWPCHFCYLLWYRDTIEIKIKDYTQNYQQERWWYHWYWYSRSVTNFSQTSSTTSIFTSLDSLYWISLPNSSTSSTAITTATTNFTSLI